MKMLFAFVIAGVDLSATLLDLAQAVLPFLLSLLSWAAYLGGSLIKAQLKSQKAKDAIALVEAGIVDTIAAGGKVLIHELHIAAQDGVVTAEERAAIRAAVLRTVKEQAGAAAIEELKKLTGDVDGWLWTKIRAIAHLDGSGASG